MGASSEALKSSDPAVSLANTVLAGEGTVTASADGDVFTQVRQIIQVRPWLGLCWAVTLHDCVFTDSQYSTQAGPAALRGSVRLEPRHDEPGLSNLTHAALRNQVLSVRSIAAQLNTVQCV